MIHKHENDSHFPHKPFLIPININCHPLRAILDFQNNLYFQETQQTNATIMNQLPSLKKKTRVLHQKGHFPCKKQATEAILVADLWNKS